MDLLPLGLESSGLNMAQSGSIAWPSCSPFQIICWHHVAHPSGPPIFTIHARTTRFIPTKHAPSRLKSQDVLDMTCLPKKASFAKVSNYSFGTLLRTPRLRLKIGFQVVPDAVEHMVGWRPSLLGTRSY